MRGSTRALVHKEFRLVLPPSYLAWALLSAFLLVPHYPMVLGAVAYVTLALFIALSQANANRDHVFTVSLPIARSQVVLAKLVTVMALELAMLLSVVPFAIVAWRLRPEGNLIGMDGNYAFFGMVLACFAVFNAVFLPGYFRTGWRIGRPGVAATIAFWLTYGALELAVNLVPRAKAVVDTLDAAATGRQLLVLAAGVLVYVAGAVYSYRRAAVNFDRVNL
jgi:ABC-2 type transport system permease protein